jgi:hypothetical protein
MLCICFILTGCGDDKMSTVKMCDITSVTIPNLQIYESGVYYGADKVSDTDLEELSVQVKYGDGTTVEKKAYLVFQTGNKADYEYVDLSDTEGKIIITDKE